VRAYTVVATQLSAPAGLGVVGSDLGGTSLLVLSTIRLE